MAVHKTCKCENKKPGNKSGLCTEKLFNYSLYINFES